MLFEPAPGPPPAFAFELTSEAAIAPSAELPAAGCWPATSTEAWLALVFEFLTAPMSLAINEVPCLRVLR